LAFFWQKNIYVISSKSLKLKCKYIKNTSKFEKYV
jgi:hypothetical protein